MWGINRVHALYRLVITCPVMCRFYRPVKQSTIFVTPLNSCNQSACYDRLTMSLRLAKLLIHVALLFVCPMKSFIHDQQFT